MLSEKQLAEIREHLEKAQNPVFFFDNDCDGLMSFILLRRFINRGRGVAIKSFPELDASYAKRIDEFNADCVFILDKPNVSSGFFEEVRLRNLPVVWIDHHDVEMPFPTTNSLTTPPNKSDENKKEKTNYTNVNIDIFQNAHDPLPLISYYNPIFSKNKSAEPTSYIAYRITNKKEDMWMAMAGCIADNFMPDFTEEFSKQYGEIWKRNAKTAFEVLYESEFGKLVMVFNFALKDRTSNVVFMINSLFKATSPFDILKAEEHSSIIMRRYTQINKVYTKLLDRAKSVARNSRKVVFFEYGGELSLSADIANELSYRFPGKIVIVAYIKGEVANVSVRGRGDIRKVTLKAIKNIEGATGGGHEHATGAKMSKNDLRKFREFFEREVD